MNSRRPAIQARQLICRKASLSYRTTRASRAIFDGMPTGKLDGRVYMFGSECSRHTNRCGEQDQAARTALPHVRVSL